MMHTPHASRKTRVKKGLIRGAGGPVAQNGLEFNADAGRAELLGALLGCEFVHTDNGGAGDQGRTARMMQPARKSPISKDVTVDFGIDTPAASREWVRSKNRVQFKRATDRDGVG